MKSREIAIVVLPVDEEEGGFDDWDVFHVLFVLCVLCLLPEFTHYFNDLLGKPHTRMMHVQTEFCQIAFQPPPPQANGRFVAGIFRRKLANSLKQRF